MTLKEITDEIVSKHHSFLRRELPRLSELLDELTTQQTKDDSALREARQLYTKVRTKIEAHLHDEETVIFPTGVALDHGGSPPESGMDLRERLQEMETEHTNCGNALGTLEQMLNRLSDSKLKDTTLNALRELRADLDVHVDKENSLVHPRLFELLPNRDAFGSTVT